MAFTADGNFLVVCAVLNQRRAGLGSVCGEVVPGRLHGAKIIFAIDRHNHGPEAPG